MSSIEEAGTGENFDTVILPINNTDLKTTIKKNGWKFNWRSEWKNMDHQVYKLIIAGESDIRGLISLQTFKNYIEMHLVETAPHNYGSSKKYAGVVGNMIAFACKMSYEYGFGGIVCFHAKTRLISHYEVTLGAQLVFGNRVIIAGKSAEKLVNSYYKNFFDVK